MDAVAHPLDQNKGVRMKNKPLIIGLSISAFALILALGFAAVQVAQTVSASAPAQLGGSSGMIGTPNGDEALAQALGITVDELNAAQQEAYQAAVQQGVDQGLITQAQADDMLSRTTGSRFGGRWMGWLFQNGVDFESLLADALGISVEDLQAAQVEAVEIRLEQAVADGRITEEQAELMRGRHALFSNETFQSSMQTAFENAVQEAVSNGVITQSQADQILEQQEGFGLRGGMLGFGGCRGGRGGFGKGGFDPGN
jgi:mannitol/fructose-specific phosphotransferase system IIA component (Ntr-type)